jgi:hypothetical protein
METKPHSKHYTLILHCLLSSHNGVRRAAPVVYMQPIEPVLREINWVFSVQERVVIEAPSSVTVARLVQENEDGQARSTNQ